MPGIGTREIERKTGVRHSTLNSWKSKPDTKIHTNSNSKVDAVLAILLEEERKLSTSTQKSRQSSTNPSHTQSTLANLDSAQLERLVAAEAEIEFKAMIVPVNQVWSAKSVMTKIKVGSAYPGAAGLAIQLDGQLGNIRQGSVLIFRESDYADPEGKYLLFQSLSDPDSQLIGWIDKEKSGTLIQTVGGEFPLNEWKVTHLAFAVMWGSQKLLSSMVSPSGITRSSKPQD